MRRLRPGRWRGRGRGKKTTGAAGGAVTASAIAAVGAVVGDVEKGPGSAGGPVRPRRKALIYVIAVSPRPGGRGGLVVTLALAADHVRTWRDAGATVFGWMR